MKRYIYLLAVCLLSCVAAKSQTGQFVSADRFSNSLVNYLCQDRLGSLWVATDYGLNRYDGYKFQTFLHSDADSTSLAGNMVVCLLCDSHDRLWVGHSHGLDLFNPVTMNFTHYAFPDGKCPRVAALIERADGTIVIGTAGYGAYTLGDGLLLHRFAEDSSDHYFSRLFEDTQGRLWHSGFDDVINLHKADGTTEHLRSMMGTPQAYVEQDGVIYIVCRNGIMTYRNGRLDEAGVDMSAAAGRDVVFWSAATSPSGTIVLGTRGNGVFTIVPGEHPRLEPLDLTISGIDMQTAKVSSVIFDRDGNLWMGCHRRGIAMMSTRPELFRNWGFDDQGIRLGSTVSSVCEGDDGITWVTVQGVGVYGFNSGGRVVAHPQAPWATEFIFRDKKRRYWVGTDDGLFSYDPLTGRSQQQVTFDCDKFNDMTSSDDGSIYISTFSKGFCYYNPATGHLRNFSMDDEADSLRGRLCNNWILAMMPDRNGRLWMATADGVACYDPSGDTFKPFGWQQLLPEVMCYSLCQTSRGDILIGTGGGLYIYRPGEKEARLFHEGFTDKIVNYIVESNDGSIWCSTSMGIWRYDARAGAFIGYVAGNGLSTKEYVMNVGMHTDDDRIFFGNNDGLTVFDPQAGDISRAAPAAPVLTAFRVAGQFVDGATTLNGINITGGKAVHDCSAFTLSYLDHTVMLGFSQFNFEAAMNMSLEYRVNGDDWIRQPEGNNEIALAHLQPGKYRIEVRALQGGEYSQPNTIVITVRAPWYRSTMAYFVYLLVIVALTALFLAQYRRRANRRLDEEKMKFLINATHDIRSPLTIILSAIKKLEPGSAADTIERNSQRILNLVNQILDVRKIDKQQMHLHCRETDMVQFVASITKMFQFNAQERGITLSFVHDGSDRLPVWVDRSQFDKVVSNLLSNAFKYTADGGTITVAVAQEPTAGAEGATATFTLSVTDTGMGLDADILRHIFDRFYQGSNSRKTNAEGTGIGLNLCKMIVDMHHGTIKAGNRSDGQQGSVFTVTLPLGTAHLRPEEIDNEPDVQEPKLPQAAQAVQTAQAASTSRKRVLIVDDDDEIGQYIKQELGRYYKFGLSSNGKDGLKELLTNDYDLVVSDVMMPEMDGFTMLRMIKSNLNLSHLPVILLTSKADVANRLEGLAHGADAYLAKPFDMQELHLTIENLIQGRRHLKGKYSGAQQQADKLEVPEVKGNDELLMERIMKAVNKNLNDSDFSVEMLCSEVGISRAQLHRKMKELTGLSTSEFIRNIRLEQAARLLKEQKINVTQVAYTVGFSNLAHFSTVFRKHFGMAPSEYAVQE